MYYLSLVPAEWHEALRTRYVKNKQQKQSANTPGGDRQMGQYRRGGRTAPRDYGARNSTNAKKVGAEYVKWEKSKP